MLDYSKNHVSDQDGIISIFYPVWSDSGPIRIRFKLNNNHEEGRHVFIIFLDPVWDPI